MKTIRQIADELGVSKQKVYRFIVKNHITASSEVKQSKFYDEAAETLIKSHFDCIATSCERSGEPHQKSGDDVLLMQLIKELEVKNEQIVSLQEELSNERQHSRELEVEIVQLAEKIVVLADQAQQLQLAQMAPQSALPDTEPAPLPAQPQRKSWWNQIFRR